MIRSPSIEGQRLDPARPLVSRRGVSRRGVSRRGVAATIAVAALAFASCASSAVAGSGVAEAEGACPRMFWALPTSSGGTLYVQGTMHLGTEELFPLHEASLAALASADVVMAELSREELEGAQGLAMERMMGASMTDSTTLRTLLPVDDYDWLLGLLGDQALGIVGSYEPWVAQTMVDHALALEAGLDPGKGVDVALYGEAERLGKTVRGLETAAFQLDALTSYSRDHLASMLRDSIREGRDHPDSVRRLYEAYRDDDREAFSRAMADSLERTLAFDERLGGFVDTLFASRNDAWALRLAGELAGGTSVYLFVGAGHCFGEGNLIERLARHGVVAVP